MRSGVLFLFMVLAHASLYDDPIMKQWLPKPITPEARVQLDALEQRVLSKSKRAPPSLVPVMVIPSFVGNQIQVKMTNADPIPSNLVCARNADWSTLWGSITKTIDFTCFLPNLKMKYAKGNYTAARKGLEYRVPYWGYTKSCDYVDTWKAVPLWNDLTRVLRAAGYEDGRTLRAAPYEWRAGPDGLKEYFNDLRMLIEYTYTSNKDRQVACVSLSMGSPIFTVFLNNMTKDWKKKYIHSFTSLSGAFGGSTHALAGVAVPDALESYRSLIKNIGYTWGAMSFLMPYPEVFGSKIFYRGQFKNYTASDFVQLMVDHQGHPEAIEIYKAVRPYQANLKAPGVKMNCVYGTGTSTTAWYKRGKLLPSFPLHIEEEDGDGTCLTQAMAHYCKLWASQGENVNIVPIDRMAHTDAPKNPTAQAVLLKTLGLL